MDKFCTVTFKDGSEFIGNILASCLREFTPLKDTPGGGVFQIHNDKTGNSKFSNKDEVVSIIHSDGRDLTEEYRRRKWIK